MGRLLMALAVIWAGAMAAASEFSALARIVPEETRIEDSDDRGVALRFGLSLGVPYRLFTLDSPPRLVIDFREVDWQGARAEAILRSARIRQVQFGAYVSGWSRFVAELSAPMAVRQASMDLQADTREARLFVRLEPVSAEAFAASAGAPYDPNWDLPAPAKVVSARPDRGPDASLVVALDPGHGGIDPGAMADGVDEKTLMLTFARELREVLLRSGGFEVVMTRDDDSFVSLDRRIALAHEAGADVFLSLHADSLADGLAHGATIHMLSEDASDVASARLAERHDRGQLLSGVDLSTADDEVTGVLLDLARQETRPRTRALAEALVDDLAQTGGPMNRRPLRAAAFSVLKAADMPSVLIEIGFISSPRDLNNLKNPEWRHGMAIGIRNALQTWRESDRARRALVRQ
jgi:N-acetylmuramoyl-L-alanine amidase